MMHRIRSYQFRFLLALLLTLVFMSTTAAQETTPELTPEATAAAFPVGSDLTIAALRELDIEGSDIAIEEALPDGANYARYRASYLSEGNKIYGLLTIPFGDVPEGGFKAIVFNHGYIPPETYVTTERYVAYVDVLAQSGFVVFKIDLRGHGDSEGEPMGSYFSPAYTIDALAAFYSLQRMPIIDPDGIGLWGHSMAGNLTLRAMLIEPGIKAGVIWAGAVYSYDDFVKYAITDTSYVAPVAESAGRRRSREISETYGQPNTRVPFWAAVSLTKNIQYLHSPLQIHHAVDDDVVNIGYSRDLVAVLENNAKSYKYFEYDSGGHNIGAPSFNLAMQRTIAFFREHL
ncbi:MAG TPA: alpha/beta fold hydrolase [Phototrophicaceae bacterium]|nr:alpha/beta fold hydrolase [Phototrophicaceae bacterium]